MSKASAEGVQYGPITESQVCSECHSDIVTKWASSHHALSMQQAEARTVLADFSQPSINHHGQKISFYQDAEGYRFGIKGTDGKENIFKVKYAFGVTPLQQYLVEKNRGKLQVFPFAWDSRPKSDGGQKWFPMYAEEYIPEGDRLHWQQPLQNWNGMCGDCHSSGFKRNYVPKIDSFLSSFTSVNVSCSSCHANAGKHVKQQKKPDQITDAWKESLLSYLDKKGLFERRAEQATAQWTGPHTRDNSEIEVCAACHSHRSPLVDGIDPAQPFMDQFSPSLLDDQLYFPDGQIKDEVYVWGSFLQSKMYAAGVSCRDCHDSHSLQLKQVGNALCTQCHAPQVFDTPKHHHHKKNTAGGECVNCHMPAKTYMRIDPRRDHSFKVPRPDISALLQTPNACKGCHQDKGDIWAQGALTKWFPNTSHKDIDSIVIAKARLGDPTVREPLAELIENEELPDITRATALSLVPRVFNDGLMILARKHLRHSSALIRIGAIRAFVGQPQQMRTEAITFLLADPYRAVRVETAKLLLWLSTETPLPEQHGRAFRELEVSNVGAGWRGEGRLNSALQQEATGQFYEAENSYRQSLEIDPGFTAAWINLADLLRRTGRREESHQTLERALNSTTTNAPEIDHAYGLSLIRLGQLDDAMPYLESAAKEASNNSQYLYVWLVALQSSTPADAIYQQLRNAVLRHPFDSNLLYYAYTLSKSLGLQSDAEGYRKRYQILKPFK